MGYLFAALPSASAELRVAFSPPCAVSLTFLVSQSKCIINNLRANGSDGKAPSGLAGLRLQPDFRLHIFLIYICGKCLRSYYWGGGLAITRPGYIHRCGTNFSSDISPFLGSIGPVFLKTS